MKRDYTTPTIKVLGSLRELTLRDKHENATPDGDVFMGKALTS